MTFQYLCDGRDEKCIRHREDIPCGCYMFGGPCRHTTHEENALNPADKRVWSFSPKFPDTLIEIDPKDKDCFYKGYFEKIMEER